MRIMDGTSRKIDNNPSKSKYRDNDKNRLFGREDPDDEKQKIRARGLKQQEEELRQYEEKVFVEHVISGQTKQIRQSFSKEFAETRKRYEQEVCPFYNGGEKRVQDTELNVNPFFEKMSQKLLK